MAEWACFGAEDLGRASWDCKETGRRGLALERLASTLPAEGVGSLAVLSSLLRAIRSGPKMEDYSAS